MPQMGWGGPQRQGIGASFDWGSAMPADQYYSQIFGQGQGGLQEMQGGRPTGRMSGHGQMNAGGRYFQPAQGGGGGGYFGGGGMGGMFGGGGFLGQLLGEQRNINAQNKQQNIATRAGTLAKLEGVPAALRNDPLFQGARGQAQSLVNDPEAINDATQQKIINRGSNLVNAAANTERDRSRQQLGGMGLLGGSAESAAMGDIERGRGANLQDMSTKLEIERATRRNQDIQQATQLAAGLAGQQSGANQFEAGTRAATDLFFKPEDLSGYGAYWAQGMGGGGYGRPSMGGGSSGGDRIRPSPFMGFGGPNYATGGMSPGQPGINPQGGYFPQNSGSGVMPSWYGQTWGNNWAQPPQNIG